MNNKVLQEYLKELPDNYDVVLSQLSIVKFEESDDPKLYNVILDIPIVGIVQNQKDNEIRFMIDCDKDNPDEEEFIKDLGMIKLINTKDDINSFNDALNNS